MTTPPDFNDFIGVIFAAWFFTYLLVQSFGGLLSLFHRGVREDHDISIKIRRQ